MKSLNRKSAGLLGLIVVVLVAAAALAGSVAAQGEATPEPAPQAGGYPLNTITVNGSGSAAGAPDMANLEVGVSLADANLANAFSQANSTIDQVIAAVQEAGVAPEDIRTTGLDIYNEQPPYAGDPNTAPPAPIYRVNNRIRITIRDIAQVEQVIDAAVNAGANNIFGLTFGFNDRGGLESEARASAMEDARARAQQLADLAGAQLGEIVIVNETPNGFVGPFDELANLSMGRGGGGATIEPGSLSVTVQLQVTFRLVR